MAQCSVEGGIALITINNPPVNALAPKGARFTSDALRCCKLSPRFVLTYVASDMRKSVSTNL